MNLDWGDHQHFIYCHLLIILEMLRIYTAIFSIVTDQDEWAFYKRANSLETPMEKNLVLQNGAHMEIFLKPMEAVHVPFIYDDLKASKQQEGQTVSTKVIIGNLMRLC